MLPQNNAQLALELTKENRPGSVRSFVLIISKNGATVPFVPLPSAKDCPLSDRYTECCLWRGNGRISVRCRPLLPMIMVLGIRLWTLACNNLIRSRGISVEVLKLTRNIRVKEHITSDRAFIDFQLRVSKSTQLVVHSRNQINYIRIPGDILFTPVDPPTNDELDK
ncbi:hypothetical protein K457DRAFT_1817670 [Linnemannia elongata AG-77]|uniref:Uncharacterized protein n=1 Tax=Linnemannia elongata AG-77 TaxID=1314771 RepID=A0A197K5N7_9FUNG|nr:hypothetical protein K457DRAFT_1817670 [Linnemannia elongata AG-77]